jgi:hypothetical protein
MKIISLLLMMCINFGLAFAQPQGEDKADQKIIATVLEKKITSPNNLDGKIFGILLEQFIKENKLEPTPEELELCVRKVKEKMEKEKVENKEDLARLLQELKDKSLAQRERKQKERRLETIEWMLKMNDRNDAMAQKIAQKLVREWKLNNALYKKYGGRVIFQQAGPEPIDAYRDFLKEQEKKGAFKILVKKYEPSFWNYFTNDSIHSFISDGKQALNTPWWLVETPQ